MRAVAFPDAEYLTTRWLNADGAVPGTRAATDLRGWTLGQRRIVVTRIGGIPAIPYRLDRPRLDVACYAESKAAAYDLAAAARASVHALPTGDHTDLGAVVAHVTDQLGISWVPDPESNAPRYLFTVALAVRPHP